MLDYSRNIYRPRLDLHRVAEVVMAVVLALVVMIEVLP